MFRGGGDVVSWETGPWLHLLMRRYVQMSGTGILFLFSIQSLTHVFLMKIRNEGGKTVTG